MNALITLAGGSPVVSSAVIAEGVGKEHKPVIRLVRDNQEDLEEFGPLRFENAVAPRPQGGGEATTIALLSEPQATLLLTYMRNNEVVRAFKKKLVRAFFEMREKLMAEEKAKAQALREEADRAKEPRSLSELTDEERRIGFTAAKKRCAGLPLSEEETRIVRLYERVKMRAYRDRRKAANAMLPAASDDVAVKNMRSGFLRVLADYSYRAEALRVYADFCAKYLPPMTPPPVVDLAKLADGIILESLQHCEIRLSFGNDGRATCALIPSAEIRKEREKLHAMVEIDDARGLCGVIRATELDGMKLEVVQQVFQACIDRLSSPNGAGYGNASGYRIIKKKS